MGNISSKTVSIYIDSTAADRALVSLQLQADKLNKKIDDGRNAGKNMTAELKRLTEVNASIKSVQDQIDKGLKPSIAQQTTLVTQLRNELRRLSESDPQFAEKLKNYQRQNEELKRMNTTVAGVSKAIEEQSGTFGKALTRVTQYFAAFSIVDTVKNTVIGFFRGSIDEAKQAEQTTSRLKNVLENIGRIDAFERLAGKAQELADQFKYLDNDSLVEVQQKLITFGKLTEGQINQLLPVIINFAAKSQISVEESSSIIIKALDGNAKALKEYGINVKDGSDVTERLGILMTDLAPRVDGAAKAFGETFAGEAAVAKQQLADIEEEVGTKLIPALTKLYSFASDALTGITKFGDVLSNTFKSGSFLLGSAITRAQAVAAQQAEIDKSAASSLLLTVQDKSIAEKQDFLEKLNAKVLNAEYQISIARKSNNKELVKNLTDTLGGFELARKQLDAELKSGADKTLLGLGGDDASTKAKDDKELEKAKARLKALSEEFSKLSQSEYAFAFQQIFQQKAEDEKLFREKFAGESLTKALDQLQKTTEQKIIDLNEKLGSKAKDNPVVVDVIPEIKEEDVALLKASMGKFLKTLGEDERNAAAQRALALLNGTNKQKLAANIGNLTAAEEKELSNTELLESEKEVIREKYRQQRSQAEQESLNEELDNISNALSYFQEAVNIAAKFNDAKTSRENAALNKQLKSNDVEKQAYKKLLDTKLITQQQYNQQIDRLDKDADAKKEALQKKQFERQKKLELINAGINGAQAVLSTIKQFGPPIPPNFAGIAAFAFTLATVGAEIAAIASKKYALGGKLEGPSHEAGGIKANVNGRHVEFEGDEGVIKKSAMRSNRLYTVTGTPSQITSSLNGMYGGVTWDTSAIIAPSYKRRPYQAVDYSRINSSYSNLKFAEGGITPGANGNGGNGQPVIINNSDDETKVLMRAVLNRLENPVAPKNIISLTKIEDAQSQKVRIQNNAGFQ